MALTTRLGRYRTDRLSDANAGHPAEPPRGKLAEASQQELSAEARALAATPTNAPLRSHCSLRSLKLDRLGSGRAVTGIRETMPRVQIARAGQCALLGGLQRRYVPEEPI